MSTNPEAILYYGFPLKDYEDDDYSYHDTNDEWEKEKRPAEPSDKSDYRTPEWDEWRRKVGEWNATGENIELTWSGAEGCYAYYVHAAGLSRSVEWNEQMPLKDFDFGQQTEADGNLKEFCQRFGLPWQTPGWHLACRYF